MANPRVDARVDARVDPRAESRFAYTIVMRAAPEALWRALIEPEWTRRYWAGTWQESQWRVGASWRLMIPDGRVGDSGEILEFDPPRRLSFTLRVEFMPDLRAEGHSRVNYDLEPVEDREDEVRLSMTQTIDRPRSKLIETMSAGWPHLFSSLKTLLESGEPLESTRQWPEGV